MIQKICVILCAVALVNAAPAFASETKGEIKRPGKAAIATTQPLVTQIGYEILSQGGNAFDAAVAIAAALAVVEPHRNGLGGGGFWLLHTADNGQSIMVDARETAPAAATSDMFIAADGKPTSGSRSGVLSAAIPGQPAALVHVAEKYGSLPLEALFSPAIRLANDGFPVYTHYYLGLKPKAQLMIDNSPAAAEVFLVDGGAPEIGVIVRQPELAKTLGLLAKHGHKGFYKGQFAKKLVQGVRDAGGIWTMRDLAAYKIIEREPMIATFGGSYLNLKLIAASPPSAGGIALVGVLNMLKALDLPLVSSTKKASASRQQRIHLNVELLRRVFRDRSLYMGDPDFTDIPAKLISPEYAAQKAKSIRLNTATPSLGLAGTQTALREGAETTHFSVMDADGNRVAVTISLNWWFGAGFMPPGTGVLLNNHMNDFTIMPDRPNGFGLINSDANQIEPGKRPLSSMAPMFLESDRGVAILGTPGGSRIISMNLLASLGWIEGLNAKQMVSLPRYHHQYLPDDIFYEPGMFSDADKLVLENMGHTLRESSRLYGNMQVITWDYANGKVEAASDPRGDKEVLVY